MITRRPLGTGPRPVAPQPDAQLPRAPLAAERLPPADTAAVDGPVEGPANRRRTLGTGTAGTTRP
ncbi:hypothetical protein ACFRK5_36180 [Streptomyces niveus]|uniref:hypothetical protein n=1 Tax=Streptomyces niveus TaxID=193462 RepID=UPI0036BEFE4C